MMNINDYFEITTIKRNRKHFLLTVRRGKFKGVVLKFKDTKFDKKQDDILNIEYEVHENPKDLRISGSACEKNLGKYIIHALTTSMKNDMLGA